MRRLLCLLALLLSVSSCKIQSTSSDDDSADDGGSSSSSCTLTENTTQTSEVNSQCTLLERDTSPCEAERTALGLNGIWLKFSCRVALALVSEGSNQFVRAQADGQPDYKSNYFASTHPCYDAGAAGSVTNPNLIEEKDIEIFFPLNPDMASQSMGMGVVGLALNGVPIFNNQAAPGDDIFEEAETFDVCRAHPTNTGQYHYHSEPYAITEDDANFVGILRDGYPVYGRKDPDGSTPALDAAGGHTGVTVDSPTTAVYHYHVNAQTSTNPGTAGQTQYFITTGTYAGTPGSASF